MDDQTYYLQHTQQQMANQNQASFPQSGMSGYPQAGHQVSHIQYQNPPYTNPNVIDYPIHPPQTGPYNPTGPSNYTGQLHHGYHQPQDQYIPQPYQPHYDYDPASQIGGVPYYNNNVALQSDPTVHSIVNPQGLQGQPPYNQYSSQLQPPGHYQSNLSIDPTIQQPGYNQYHPHSVPNTGSSLDPTNYMPFGQQGQYPLQQGTGYLPFNQTVQPLHNGQIPHHPPYGLVQNQNQLGIVDSLQSRPPQHIGKGNIKNEELTMDNELHLLNSLADSQSQAEDKIKQPGSGYLLPSQFEQQQYPPYYALGQNQQNQNQYFQGYQQYPSGHLQQIGSQGHIMQNPNSQTSIKDDPSKKQPGSPGRKKTIKKGSPTGNTEPSSPASPRGRKKKSTIKGDQPQPESSSTLNTGIMNQQQQQFGLHLVKVPTQDTNQMYSQNYYSSMNTMGKVIIDPNTQHISGIDQNSLQRLKELPTDFNMNEFVYDDQKQIGSITKEERKQKIKNYQEKRKRRSWQKKISYDVRKKVADGRLRVKGRFVTKKQAMEMLSIVGREEDYTMDQLKEMLKQRGVIPAGGDEESKSPTLPKKKKNQSQPGTIVSLKQGEEDDDDGYLSGEVHSAELPLPEPLPIVRGKSCENINISSKGDYFQSQNDQYYPNMNNQINNNKIENQLYLKLDKERDAKQNLMNQQQYQNQQLQQQQSYNSHQQPQSPLKSPNKKQNPSGTQNNNSVKFLDTQQQHHMNQNQNHEQINNINGNSSYADLQNGESPQNSAHNILSQEMADQFGNLNIKSPGLKQKRASQNNNNNNNPKLLTLNDANQTFFGNQPNQNQYQYNQQQYNVQNGNNGGYPIHQQQ